MKKASLFTIICCVIALLIPYNTTTAQNMSTVGTDFHVMFLRNDKNFPLSNSGTYFPGYLHLIMTGKNPCSGTITSTNGSFTNNFTVTPGQITEINIPKNNYPDKQAGYSYKSGFVENKGLHITADDSISLYAVNYSDASFDITNVLPTSSLGYEYIIQNYKGTMVAGKYSGASFVIVATEDQTVVDITPTTTTGIFTPGNSSQTTTYNSGQTITVTLNAGQSYQLLAWSTKSFDGTYIKARDCKKIAVFQGNGITPVPGTVNAKKYYGYEDHLYEQCIPTNYWGKQFIVTQTLQRANDRVKVTALNDGCTVKINGTLMTTLSARETYEFEIVKDQAADTISAPIDKVYGTAHYIETSEPASVFLFLTSRQYGNAIEQIGDPSMVLVTPVEQQIDYVTFSTFETDRVKLHHINIITETSQVGNMTLDGASIASEFSSVSGNTDYSYARLDLEHGAHTLQCPGGGFIAHVYGFGQTAGKDESYAYTVGTGVKDLNKQLFIDETNLEDIAGTFEACSNEDIEFVVTTNYAFDNIEWIFGDNNTGSGDTITHAYAEGGNYEVMALIHRQEAECDMLIDTLVADVIIRPASDTLLTFQSCNEVSVTVNGETFTSSGDFTQTFTNQHGCDSIVNIHISLGNIETEFDSVVCNTIEWGGYTCDTSGTYIHTYPSIGGCDSIVTMHLSVNHAYDTTLYDTACKLPYEWNGVTFTEAGVQDITIQLASGCDSIVHLDLTVNETRDTTLFANICSNNLPYTWDNVTFVEGGPTTLVDTVQTASGCDSLVTKTITIKEPYEHEEVREFCRNDVDGDDFTNKQSFKYHWYEDEEEENEVIFSISMPLNTTETFTMTKAKTYTDINGCDSIITRTLIIYPSYRFKETVIVCDNELPYYWNGQAFTPTFNHMVQEIYENTVQHGCDSVFILDITKKHADTAVAFNVVVCDSYTWVDTTYSTPGSYTRLFENAEGCDSIVTMHLTILRNDIVIDSSVCEKLVWNGSEYTTHGSYTQTFTNQYNCDSVVTINLTILRDSSEFTQEACGEFIWNDIPYTTSGNHVQHFTNKYGCDSTVTLHLTIHPVYDNISETREICENELPYTWYPGIVFTHNGKITEDLTLTQTNTLHSIHNCDSIVNMTLIVHPIYDTTDTRTICEDELPYDWDGVEFTHAFTQSHTFKNQYNCDSTVTMTLIVNPHDTVSETRTICQNELPYTWNEGEHVVFNEGGTETHTLTSSLNCDSTVFMTLVINPIHEVNDTKTICDDLLPYTWDNIEFTEAGSATDTLKNAYNCDSVVHKTLIVNPTYENIYDTNTVCQNELPYTWYPGIVFNNPGTLTETDTITQTHTLTSSLGCDSTVTMSLIVHPMYKTTDSRTICQNELPYDWNGVEFSEATTITHKFQTIHGCDSTVTMTLKVNPIYENVIETRTICDDKIPYTWEALLPEENVTFNEAGTQTHTLTSSLGCDSTVTMTLIVNPTFKETETREICADELPYQWYPGVTFTHEGEITEELTLTQEPTLQTVNNCDSTITMTLIVHPTYNTSDEKTICEDELPYEWNGVIFTEATDGIAHLKSIYGCDSIVGLTLHVNPHDTVSDSRKICYNELPYEWYPGIVFDYDGDVTEDVTLNETHTITSSLTCDSTIHMTLIIQPIYVKSETRTICDDKIPYTWEALLPEENVTFNEAGTQTHTLTSSLGCDSTVTMTLIVNPTFKETETREICANELPYQWYPGVMFTHEGEITEDVTLTQEPTLQTVNNCDSIVTMTLIVHPTYNEIDSRTICQNELPYDWNGVEFSEATTITHKFQTIHGCDSTVTMTLKVNPIYENVIETRTICDDKIPYTWEALLPEENVTFNEAGTQTHTLTSSLGCDSTVTMTLIVNPTFKETETREICADELPYQWYPGVTFTHEGEITEELTLTQEPTLQTVNNCDSIVTMTLIVHPTYNETETRAICEDELPYEWNGVLFTEASSDIAHLESIHKCDSVVGMTLIVYPHDTVSETRTICYNELPYEWYPGIVFNYNGEVTESVTMNETHTITSSHDCDSTIHMTLVINPIYTFYEERTICDSELDYEWHDSIFTGPVTDYPMVFHSANNCDSTFILTLVVNPTYLYEEEETICASELPYKWHEYIFTEAGHVDTTFLSQNLCDSTYKMTLNVNPIYNVKDTVTICSSLLPYTWDNITFDGADTQIDSLETKLGCDSVVEKTLIVNEIFTFYDYDTICDSELSYEWHDSIFTGPVTDYPMVFHSADNCDSTLILTLVVHPTYDESETRRICSAQLPYEWNGLIFNEAADSIAILTTIHGCDSVVGMKLIVDPTYDSIADTRVICDDELPYYWDSQDIFFTEAETQVHTLTSSLNCDSTVYMKLIVNPTYAFVETDTICDNQLPYTWHEVTFYGPGTQDTTFQSHLLCDSSYTLTLYVMPTYNYTEDRTICASELPYIWHEHEFTEAGSFTAEFKSQYGCDSIHNMTLYVNPIYAHDDSQTICDDALPYTWGGVTFTEAGVLVDSMQTTLGCDSVVTKTLFVNPTYAFIETDTICDNQLPYTWHEVTFYGPGTQDTLFQSELHCDSSYSLTLFVMPTYNYTEDSTICASELPLMWHEHEFTEAGSFTAEFESQYGCDSIHNMTLFVNPIYAQDDNRTICDDALPYTWDGVTFTEAGVLVDSTLTTINGCDSIVTKTLFVNPTYAFIETDTVCDNELPYTWHEVTFYGPGTQDTIFQSELHCDSSYSLTLYVMPTYNYTEDSTICASELPLMWHEHEFTEAGSFTAEFESQYGCDSIHNMTLFVNPIYAHDDSRTICDDALPYTWDGVTFTEAGVLVDSTLTTINGCDSIVTKTLFVNPTKTFEFDVEVCDQYTWNNETYNMSGDYDQSFLTTLGCDSTVTLHLIVNHSTTHSFDTIACEEFVWNGIPYTESGVFVQNLHTVHNCDSIVTANLTIGHHTPAEIFVEACDSYSIEDSVYIESGTYEQTINTVLGCDSIITLHLTLDYTPDANIIGDRWVVGGSETNISKYHYYVVPTHDVVVIDTVEWFIDCPNWHVDPIGNGEHSDLYIHTFLPGDSIELRATVYSNCGSATQSIWIHTSYFGIDEETSNSSVVIMPNPNKGDMTIRLENITGDATIYVYDLLGNIIDKFRINNRDEVALIPYSLRTKAEATYTFVIVTDSGTFTRKVVVGNK